MNAAPDFGTAIRQNGSPKHDFPLQNGPNHHPVEYQNYIGGGAGGGGGMQNQQPNHQQQQQQQQDLTIDGIPNNFPHRRSRASRTFKNPPQPHMCIKERTLDGKEVFINVLSWTRIANPDNPDAPIPLYGGMKVGKIPPGSPKAPPLVYAVMASPEVLKKAGRKCPDTPERMNLVDLMCEFVEAMNPSLHLSRKPEILKDRDLSGELKDVWSAVQACRDKGRSDNGPPENLVVYTEFGPDSAPSYEQTIQQHHHQQQHQQQLQYQQQYDQLPNTPDQQGRFPLSTGQQQQQHHYPYHHQQQQQQQQQQSAITHNNHSNSSILTSIEPISTLSATDGANGTDGSPLNGSSCYAMLDEFLSKEAESLRLSASNGSNGTTLPNADGNANSTLTSSSSASSTPTVPQTSPTNPPTSAAAAAASATPAPVPAKEATKSSSGHTFFPMFRSSKSSSSSSSSSSTTTNSNSSSGANNNTANNAQLNAGSQAGEKPTVNGGSEPAAPVSSAPTTDSAQGAPEPPTPKAAKTSSKKSGLNFFRRNKSSTAAAASDTASSKKDPSTTPTKQPPAPVVVASVLPAGLSSATSAPATPAATGAASTGPTEAKLQDNMPDALPSHGLANHRTHQHGGAYHLDGGSNNASNGGGGGDGEIHETTSAATIAAK